MHARKYIVAYICAKNRSLQRTYRAYARRVCDTTLPPQYGVIRIDVFDTFHVRGMTNGKSASKVSEYQAFDRRPDIRYHAWTFPFPCPGWDIRCDTCSGTKNNSLAAPRNVCTQYPHVSVCRQSGGIPDRQRQWQRYGD